MGSYYSIIIILFIYLSSLSSFSLSSSLSRLGIPRSLSDSALFDTFRLRSISVLKPSLLHSPLLQLRSPRMQVCILAVTVQLRSPRMQIFHLFRTSVLL